VITPGVLKGKVPCHRSVDNELTPFVILLLDSGIYAASQFKVDPAIESRGDKKGESRGDKKGESRGVERMYTE
jgi:hypothetical protein